MKQSRVFIGGFKCYLKLPKKNLRIMEEILTGHYRLSHHLGKLGTACSPGASIHVLGLCLALVQSTLRHPGEFLIADANLVYLELGNILEFLLVVGVLEYTIISKTGIIILLRCSATSINGITMIIINKIPKLDLCIRFHF